MRDTDLQLLDDIERVAMAAEQLLREQTQRHRQALGAPRASDTTPRRSSRLDVGTVPRRMQNSCLRLDVPLQSPLESDFSSAACSRDGRAARSSASPGTWTHALRRFRQSIHDRAGAFDRTRLTSAERSSHRAVGGVRFQAASDHALPGLFW